MEQASETQLHRSLLTFLFSVLALKSLPCKILLWLFWFLSEQFSSIVHPQWQSSVNKPYSLAIMPKPKLVERENRKHIVKCRSRHNQRHVEEGINRWAQLRGVYLIAWCGKTHTFMEIMPMALGHKRKQAEQAKGSKSDVSVLPCSLLQFLTPGLGLSSCPGLPWRWSLTDKML